jgi:hypothetical protein
MRSKGSRVASAAVELAFALVTARAVEHLTATRADEALLVPFLARAEGLLRRIDGLAALGTFGTSTEPASHDYLKYVARIPLDLIVASNKILIVNQNSCCFH